ncbi:MAG TPA: MFS transporter, partial [Thermoanaerobaculia bacterium]|nr:MFS transporter [Thermoanaerobaculia bacterium]
MPLFVQAVARAYRDAFAGLPRAAWLLSVITFVHRSGTMVLPFLTLYLTGPLGYTSEHAAWMFAVFGLGSLAGTYLGGWATDRFGSQPVQAWSLVAAGAG